MKIRPDEFRVRPGSALRLGKRPTRVQPYYASKAHYQELLAQHVAQLSARQSLLYAHDRYALLLVFQAMDAAGKDGADDNAADNGAGGAETCRLSCSKSVNNMR